MSNSLSKRINQRFERKNLRLEAKEMSCPACQSVGGKLVGSHKRYTIYCRRCGEIIQKYPTPTEPEVVKEDSQGYFRALKFWGK